MALETSAICLGTATYGSQTPPDACYALLDRYAESGGAFIDTAHIYGAWAPDGANGGYGNSEKVIGDWLRRRGGRERLFIATKGGHPDFSDKAPRLNCADLLRQLDESLERLRTDYVDLYWLHRDERRIPADEILSWLEGPRADGRVRAVGCSHWRVDRLAAARTAIAASQIAASLAASNWDRSDGPFGEQLSWDAETRAFHAEHQFPLVAYNTQAMGLFAGKYDGLDLQGDDFPNPGLQKRYANDLSARRRRAAGRIARRRGCSANQVALAYLLRQPFPLHAIVGPKDPRQLDDSLGAARLRLEADEMAQLENGA